MDIIGFEKKMLKSMFAIPDSPKSNPIASQVVVSFSSSPRSAPSAPKPTASAPLSLACLGRLHLHPTNSRSSLSNRVPALPPLRLLCPSFDQSHFSLIPERFCPVHQLIIQAGPLVDSGMDGDAERVDASTLVSRVEGLQRGNPLPSLLLVVTC
jgi:hypothetical protein